MSENNPTGDERNLVRRAVGSVLFNVSNFPDRAQSRLWGANMGPLNEKITDAVLEALPVHTPTDDEQRVPGFAEREKRAAIAWEFFTPADREMSHDFRGGYHQGVIDEARRSEVPEPSAGDARPGFFPNGQCRHHQVADGWAKIWCIRTEDGHTEHETEAGVVWTADGLTEPQGEPSGHDDGCADFYPEYGAPEGGVCKVCGDRVQGEPSDAQVPLHVAIQAVDAALRSYDYPPSRQGAAEVAVAALRAAGVAK